MTIEHTNNGSATSTPAIAAAPKKKPGRPAKKAPEATGDDLVMQQAQEAKTAAEKARLEAFVAYIATHQRVREPACMGVRVRCKTDDRPTTVILVNEAGQVETIELATAEDEINFARGLRIVGWRLATEDELTDMAADRSAFPPDFVLSVKKRELKGFLGESVPEDLPKQAAYALVPATFDGFRPALGDRLLVPHGSEGNYLAATAFQATPEELHTAKGGRVVRCTTIFLKNRRDEYAAEAVETTKSTKGRGRPKKAVDPKDQDPLLLARALASGRFEGSLRAVTAADVTQTKLGTAFNAFLMIQRDRKAAEQHKAIVAKNRVYLESGYTLPLMNMAAITGDTTEDHVEALKAAEKAAKDTMEAILETIPVYRDVIRKVKGIGPSIAARVLVSIGDIERFSREEWNPNDDIQALEVEIGALLVQLGLKAEASGPTLPTALAEGETVALDSLEHDSPLWHHRVHLVHPAGSEKAGQPQTYRLLHVLLHKWTEEAGKLANEAGEQRAAARAAKSGAHKDNLMELAEGAQTRFLAQHNKVDAARRTLELFARKHRLETDLHKVGIKEVRMRRMVGALQKYLGVFVDVHQRGKDGKITGIAPREQWSFARRMRGVVGGWKPEGRQGCYLLGVQALKDCDPKNNVFGPLREALSFILLEYKRRHPLEIEVRPTGSAADEASDTEAADAVEASDTSAKAAKPKKEKVRHKFGPKYCLRAACWQLASKFIEWLVRGWMAFNAGEELPELFTDKISRATRAKYPAAIINRALRMKSAPEDLAWQPGDPEPVIAETTGADDEDTDLSEAVTTDAAAN